MSYEKLMKKTMKALIKIGEEVGVRGASTYPSKGRLASAIRVKLEKTAN